MPVTEQIKSFLRAHQEESLALLKTLAQIPAPSGQEGARMAFCRDWLAGIGAKGVYTDAALNVAYPYGVGPEGPVVAFLAHTDTVFPDTAPMPWREENGRIYCPGVMDDTANLVNLLMAAKFVTEYRLQPRDAGVLFVCNSGEEGMGNLKGCRQICTDYQGRLQALYSFDLTLDEIICRAVGSQRFSVTARAQGGHSFHDFGRENAIRKLAAVIEGIYAIQPPAFGTTTYNVGTIRGGTSVNTIAQQAEMLCEFRSDEDAGLQWMAGQFQSLFDRPGLEVRLVGSRPCGRLGTEGLEMQEKMIQRAEQLIEAVTGKKPARTSGSTDCNLPLSMGIPSICIGTCYGAGAHTREEYLLADSMLTGCEVAIRTVLEYFQD